MHTSTIYFRLLYIAMASGLLFSGTLAAANPSEATRQSEYSLGWGHLALNGYDPVSYFHESGPLKGKKSLTVEHNGVRYRFSSKANLATFLKDPLRYEPEYGGWCAWAMLEGGRTKPHPDCYKIIDGKIYLFYDGLFGDTLKKWNDKLDEAPEAKLIQAADEQWSGQIQ